jgi:hypothetical protein
VEVVIIENNDTQSKEEALKKSNEGINTLWDNKTSTPSTEINRGELPQPSAEAEAQAANLILSAAQQLFQASRLKPRLGDCINKAISMLQEGIRPLVATDSLIIPEKIKGSGL